jgi:hypothetical protein
MAAALRLARGQRVTMLSAEGAAGWLGPAGWRALVARAAALAPGAPFDDLLCCGAAPGHALAALRAGCRGLVLEAGCPAFAQVAGAAAECGAALLGARPPALALRGLDLRKPAGRARLADWLTRHPHDTAVTSG